MEVLTQLSIDPGFALAAILGSWCIYLMCKGGEYDVDQSNQDASKDHME